MGEVYYKVNHVIISKDFYLLRRVRRRFIFPPFRVVRFLNLLRDFLPPVVRLLFVLFLRDFFPPPFF